MTRPITTAPADTASAMHAAEMRGLDMQDDQDCTDCEGSGITHQTECYCTCGAGLELARYAAVDNQDAPERIWIDSLGSMDTYDDGSGVIGYTRTDLCITEAECQRRIDAAVQAERVACAAVAAKHAETGRKKLGASETRQEADNWSLIVTRSDLIYDAIRARGQK